MPLPSVWTTGTLPITIYQGSPFKIVVHLRDKTTGNYLDLTGLGARAQVRESFASSNVTATILCEITDPVNGEITCTMTSTLTAGIKSTKNPTKRTTLLGVWDLELTLLTEAQRVLEGDVTLSREVTRG